MSETLKEEVQVFSGEGDGGGEGNCHRCCRLLVCFESVRGFFDLFSLVHRRPRFFCSEVDRRRPPF